MAIARKDPDQNGRVGDEDVDHAFLDSLTDDDIERMAEADAEEHGYRLETYEWIVENGRMVYPEDRDAPESPTAAKIPTPDR